MASKIPKKTEEEDKALISTLQNIWVCPVTPQLLKNLTPEFTNEIFAKCLNELESNCFAMFKDAHEERLGDLMMYRPANVDCELFLYVHVKHILDLIHIKYVTLTDFYRPPNRAKLSMRIFLNFLLFVKKTYPEGYQIVQDVHLGIEKYNKSIERQQQIREERSEIYEEIGRIQEERNTLQSTGETLSLSRMKFEEENTKKLTEVEEKERKNALLELRIKELEEQIKSIDDSNCNLQAKIVSDEEVNTKRDTLKRLSEQADLFVQKEIETNKVVEEKCKNICHLQQLQTILNSVDLTTLNCIQELDNAETRVDMANSDELRYQKDRKYLEKSLKTIESEIGRLKKNAKSQDTLRKKKQKDFEKKYKHIENNYKTEINHNQSLNNQAQLLEENINTYKIKCQETENEIQRIVETNSSAYEKMLASYMKSTATLNEKFKIPPN